MRDLSMDRRKKTLDDSLNTSNVMDKSLNESVESIKFKYIFKLIKPRIMMMK